MKRKWGVISVGILLGLTAGAAGTGWSIHHVPSFYRDALRAQPDPAQRQQQAENFVQSTLRLVEDIHHEDEWSQEFSEEQVNSWLAEELPRNYAHWLPAGVSEPRIHITQNAIEVAFRYTLDDWDTIVNARLIPKLQNHNRLSVEFAGAQAGLIPIPLDDFLAELSRLLTLSGWDFEWAENDHHSVIIVRFSSDYREAPVLESLNLDQGLLKVSGRRRFTGDARLAQLLLTRLEDELLRIR